MLSVLHGNMWNTFIKCMNLHQQAKKLGTHQGKSCTYGFVAHDFWGQFAKLLQQKKEPHHEQKNIISTKRTSPSPPCNWRKELKKESRKCREEETCEKRLTPKYLLHGYEVAAHISNCTRTNSTRHNHLGKWYQHYVSTFATPTSSCWCSTNSWSLSLSLSHTHTHTHTESCNCHSISKYWDILWMVVSYVCMSGWMLKTCIVHSQFVTSLQRLSLKLLWSFPPLFKLWLHGCGDAHLFLVARQ